MVQGVQESDKSKRPLVSQWRHLLEKYTEQETELPNPKKRPIEKERHKNCKMIRMSVYMRIVASRIWQKKYTYLQCYEQFIA